MVILVNGKKTDTADGATLVELLRQSGLGENADGVAVAVNSTVVPKRTWGSVRLTDGDVVELIHAVQGG
jgi:sulfur carrier protein